MQREYTASDYYRQIDGLGYEEVVTFTDPTGERARLHRKAYNSYLTATNRRFASAPRPGAYVTGYTNSQLMGVRGTPNTQGRGW